MERTTLGIIGVMLIIGVSIGSVVGYKVVPKKVVTETITVEKRPLEGTEIPIAFLGVAEDYLEQAVPLFQEIIAGDLNEYMKKLGYDATFEFLVDHGQGQPAISLEKVQGFKAMGINSVIGFRWSSHAQACLSYLNENNMLGISSASTSPILAIANDNLYRLCPTDLVQAPAIAEMLWSWGIEAIVVFQRAGAWGDGIYNILETEFPNRGGVILDRIRYAADTKEFSTYLDRMNQIITNAIEEYGAEHVAIQWMGGVAPAVVITQSEDYPALRKILWFGCENAGRNQIVIDDAGESAVGLRVFSSMMGPAGGWKWDNFEARFVDSVKLVPNFYSGCEYDAAWTLALAMLETGSLDATDIINVYPEVTSSYFGVTGWTELDEAGDRKPGTFDIYGYCLIDGKPSFQKYGEYDGREIEVNWFLDVLEEQGLSPPGH